MEENSFINKRPSGLIQINNSLPVFQSSFTMSIFFFLICTYDYYDWNGPNFLPPCRARKLIALSPRELLYRKFQSLQHECDRLENKLIHSRVSVIRLNTDAIMKIRGKLVEIPANLYLILQVVVDRCNRQVGTYNTFEGRFLY